VIKDLEKGTHTVVVKVDNRLNDESLPKDGVDWFPFGGIYRLVYAEFVPDMYIDRFHVMPSEISSKQARLGVRIFLKNLSGKSSLKMVKLFINGIKHYSKAVSIGGCKVF